MRLAVSGTHRVGKTTLGQRLAELLPDHEFLDEPYHELVGEGRVFSDPPGIEDFEDQLSYSIASLEQHEEYVIFDRCPVDFLAYLIALEGDADEVLERWGEEVRAAMGSLDGVILVPVEVPERVDMAPDLDGAVDREAVDEIVRDLLLNDPLELDVQVVEVRGSVSARARAVLEWLGGVGEVLEDGSRTPKGP